jgi:hypothetical protein
MKKNIVEIFFAGKNFSAHVPLLPGCVSTGRTPDEIKNNDAHSTILTWNIIDI